MGIPLQKLDSFLSIHVTLEPSNFLNEATNQLFRPLHHVMGQNKYKSLQGKITPVPDEKSPPGALFSFYTLKKVVAFLLAFVFTPFGMITRGLSWSSDVNRAYTLDFLLHLPDDLFYSLAPNQFPEGLYANAQELRTTTTSSKPAPIVPSTEHAPPLSTSTPPTVPLAAGYDGFSSAPEPLKLNTEAPILEETSIESNQPNIASFVQFLIDLDGQLEEHPTDSATIQAWLDSEVSKEDYPSHFFMAQIHLYDLYMADSPAYAGTKGIYENCVKRLKALGLERYINEVPNPRFLQHQKRILADSPFLLPLTQTCLTVLRPLSQELQNLTGSKEENQETIKAWFDKIKKESRPKYENPFFIAPYVLYRARGGLLTGILDEGTLNEIDGLYTDCRNRLLALDLKRYVKEKPPKRDLCTAIEQSIQNPSDPASFELLKHFRFYLKKYPEIFQQLVPSELLERCEGVFGTMPEEALALPSDAAVDSVRTFYMTLLVKMKTSNDSALSWLIEQASSPEYCHPFYFSCYWQTIADLETNRKLKLIAEFHKKIVVWLHEVKAEQLLFEAPPNIQPGIFHLVHSIAGMEIITPILNSLPQATPPNPTPVQSLVPDHSKVDDALFKKIMGELLPEMAPLLENKEMFQYWKNSLLDRAVCFCVERSTLCQQVQTKQNKKDVDHFLGPLKAICNGPVHQLSQDYVGVIDKLAPLLPPEVVDTWKTEYAKCCRFLEQLLATDYLTVKAPPFLGDTYPFQRTLKDEWRETVNFFKRLDLVKKDEDLLQKIENDELIKKHSMKPFWFARKFEALCTGYGVIFLPKEKKELKKLFKAITERLTQLNQQRFLQEAAPARYFPILEMIGVSRIIVEQLKKMK